MERQYVKGLVSVITPVFNAEKHLAEAIDSVLAQTYKNIEIILVDDCSTDNSAQIISDYMKNNSQIIYFRQEKNMGAGAARNKCLELASGEYVAFLDSDDVWRPEKTEKQLELLNRKSAAFAFTAIEMIDGEGKQIKEKRSVKAEVDYSFLLSNTMIPTSSVLVNRSKKGDFRMHLRRGGQDYATWLSLLRDGTIAYGIDEALVGYRIDGASLSSNKLDSIRQIWEIQTQEEKIAKPVVCKNIIIWIWNSVKKYFL